MNEKRRALGRGLGALIPTSPGDRPVDVFFGGNPTRSASSSDSSGPEHAGRDESGDHGDHGEHSRSAEHGERGEPGEPGDIESSADGGLRPVPGARFAELPLDAIRPNPRQPRSVFDEDELDELVHSVREIGVLQPVVVRPIARAAGAGAGSGSEPVGEDRGDIAAYELVMGERRWRAARAAGLTHLPAIVRTTADEDLLRDALLENLHRSQLNPLEEAAAYRQLLDDFGCSQDELATRIGRSRPQVTNTLRLLRLPPIVQRRVAAGVLSAGHARALLGLADAAAMERLAQRVVAEGLSVRTVEEIVAVGLEGPATARAPRPGARRPQLDELAARLSDRFDTRVRVALGRRRGRLVVEFASVEDLKRILTVMGVSDAESHRT